MVKIWVYGFYSLSSLDLVRLDKDSRLRNIAKLIKEVSDVTSNARCLGKNSIDSSESERS